MDTLIIFGAEYLYLFIVTATLVYIWRQPKELRWEIAVFAAIALPLTYIIAKISSAFYYDPRPFVIGQFTPLLPHAPDNGFPSDHTLLSSAIATVILFFHRRLGLLLLGGAFVVGALRVFAGVHHFIDIFGSMAIALVVTLITWKHFLPGAWKLFSKKYLGTTVK